MLREINDSRRSGPGWGRHGNEPAASHVMLRHGSIAREESRSAVTEKVGSKSKPLHDGWAALRAGRWQTARSRFSAAVAARATPEALEGLSWAAWWLDDAEAMFAAREQAFQRYRDAGDTASAARMATWLAADHLDFRGALAMASGWLDRARRLLEPLDPGPDHGWLAFHRGFIAGIRGETAQAEADAVLAAELGRKFGVPDLEMLGLALQGMTLVSRANVRDGMRCLDEASAIALSDEAEIPISTAWTCCFLVTACTTICDFERAFEWCDRIAEFAHRYGSRYMLGFCRAEYADIHLWRGEWAQAEKSLEESIAAYEASRPVMTEGPLVLLAELRRRQGRREEAHELLSRAGAAASSQLCRANLALDGGDTDLAIDLAQRVARNVPADRPLQRVPVLEVLVRAQIAAGLLEGAATAAHELRAIADVVGTTALVARTSLAEGMLAAARGDHEAAKSRLEDAVDAFERCRAPYEAARARSELASTLVALGKAAGARREALRAHECFRSLGAALGKQPARELAYEGSDDIRWSGLSPREREVLGLLAQGLTNRQISDRLFISEHTVHRHVTSILRKLDVPSRAAAAAWAARVGLIADRKP
jgi:LuxR family transcriptional regulator, maltose regulon positive regulatory protein